MNHISKRKKAELDLIVAMTEDATLAAAAKLTSIQADSRV
jgi:hypothetical protein